MADSEYKRGALDAAGLALLSEFEYRGYGKGADFNEGWKAAMGFISLALKMAVAKDHLEELSKAESYRIEVSRDEGKTWIDMWTVGGKPKTFPTCSHARCAWDDHHIDRECEWEYVRLVKVEPAETITVVMDYSPNAKQP